MQQLVFVFRFINNHIPSCLYNPSKLVIPSNLDTFIVFHYNSTFLELFLVSSLRVSCGNHYYFVLEVHILPTHLMQVITLYCFTKIKRLS